MESSNSFVVFPTSDGNDQYHVTIMTFGDFPFADNYVSVQILRPNITQRNAIWEEVETYNGSYGSYADIVIDACQRIYKHAQSH